MKQRVLPIVLLAALALSNACLDYTAMCLYLDTDPWMSNDFRFGPNNAFAGLIALAQSLLLIALPTVGAMKWAAGKRGMCAISLVAALFVAVCASCLRVVGDPSTSSMSIDGTFAFPVDLATFCLVMLVAAVGEGLISFMFETIRLKTEAEYLRAYIKRLEALEHDIDKNVEFAAEIAFAVAQTSAAEAKKSCELVWQELIMRSGDLQNTFCGYVSAFGDARSRQRELIDELLFKFKEEIGADRKASSGNTKPVRATNTQSNSNGEAVA